MRQVNNAQNDTAVHNFFRVVAKAAADTPKLFFDPLFQVCRWLRQQTGRQPPSAVTVIGRNNEKEFLEKLAEARQEVLAAYCSHRLTLAIEAPGSTVLRFETLSVELIRQMAKEIEHADYETFIAHETELDHLDVLDRAEKVYRSGGGLKYGNEGGGNVLGNAGRMAESLGRVILSKKMRLATCST